MTMLPFRGRCHTCGHDHDAEDQRLRDVLDICKQAQPRQLVSVSSIDIEKMLAECVPGGHSCDPQEVADNIRRYCDAWPAA